jgi:hypothetical protein
MLRAETPQEQFNLIGAGRRNLLINGDFQVWQRGTTFSSLTASDYTADRWISYASSTSNTTTTRQSFSAGQTDVEGNPKYFLRLDNTPDADTTWMELFQRVEDVTYFSAVYVTLSFWIKSNRNSVSDNNFFSFRQNFGSGGSSTVSTASSTFEISTGWEKKTLTVHLPSISGKTVGTGSYLEVHLAQSSSVTADTYYDIANVQLEVGKVATPFEHRSYGEELALCKRYYQEWGRDNTYAGRLHGIVNSSGTGIFHWDFPVTMRVTPTWTVYGSGTAGGTFTFNTASGHTHSATALSFSNGDLDARIFNVSGFPSGSYGSTCWVDSGTDSGHIGFVADSEL